MRRAYWSRRLRHLGSGVAIDEGVSIENPRWVSIGDGSWLDRGVTLIGGPPRSGREVRHVPNPAFAGRAGQLTIGSGCHIATNVLISGMGGVAIGDGVTISAGSLVYSLSHHYRSFDRPWDTSVGFGSMIPDARQALVQGAVVFEDDVGVGAGCLVLPGTHLKASAFLLPHSVVRGVIGRGQLAGGNPAKEVGDRYAPASA
jgi:acetyltransferase-like isoleucine patch superfamily enzyme